MIVPQAEIDRVVKGKPRRRQMMLPVERGPTGARLPCPLEVEQVVSLQSRPFVKGTKVTVTEIWLSALGSITDSQARQQGYGGSQRAREEHERRFGEGDAAVWMVQFALGDFGAFYERHRERYLARKLGRRSIVTDPDHAASGEGAVPSELELAFAAQARVKREAANQKEWQQLRRTCEQTIQAMRNHEFGAALQGDLQFMERRLEKLDRMVQRVA